MNLRSLGKLARHELAQLNFPAPNWVPPSEGPDGKALLDALIVGGGMCGQTATFALLREGVRNLRCAERAPHGREGSGAPRWARFASFKPSRQANVFHSADDIDFRTLKGKRIGVLGAGASAFDNAAEALEAGAKEVVMFARRPCLPQVNKSKWTAFPGFQHGYASLDDAHRWRFYTYIFSEQVPPPYESVLRCERHAGFSMRFGEGWSDILPGPRVVTPKEEHRFDAVIVCTGFDVNLTDRPEVAPFRDAIETWRSHVPPEEAENFPEEARFPYLGDAFQLQGSLSGLDRVHVFNWGSTMSHAALAGDIPGLDIA